MGKCKQTNKQMNIGPGNVLLPNSNFIILASDENWNLTVYHKIGLKQMRIWEWHSFREQSYVC